MNDSKQWSTICMPCGIGRNGLHRCRSVRFHEVFVNTCVQLAQGTPLERELKWSNILNIDQKDSSQKLEGQWQICHTESIQIQLQYPAWGIALQFSNFCANSCTSKVLLQFRIQVCWFIGILWECLRWNGTWKIACSVKICIKLSFFKPHPLAHTPSRFTCPASWAIVRQPKHWITLAYWLSYSTQ